MTSDDGTNANVENVWTEIEIQTDCKFLAETLFDAKLSAACQRK